MRTMLAILCSAALVAGCGGDDEEDETTPAVDTAPPAETQPPGPPRTAEPEVTVPEKPPSEDDSGGAAAPEGDEDARDGAITAPGACGRVAFAQNTDSGASGIQAVGVDCDSARAIARAAGGHGDDLSYETRGFSCSGAHRDEPPLPRIDWVCLRGDEELVRFSSS